MVCIRTNPRSSGAEGVCITRNTNTRLKSPFWSKLKRYLSEDSEFDNYSEDATTANTISTTEKNYDHHHDYNGEVTTAFYHDLEQRHHEEGHGDGEVTTPIYTGGYSDKRHHSEGHVVDEHEPSLSDDAALIKLLSKLLKSE